MITIFKTSLFRQTKIVRRGPGLHFVHHVAVVVLLWQCGCFGYHRRHVLQIIGFQQERVPAKLFVVQIQITVFGLVLHRYELGSLIEPHRRVVVRRVLQLGNARHHVLL